MSPFYGPRVQPIVLGEVRPGLGHDAVSHEVEKSTAQFFIWQAEQSSILNSRICWKRSLGSSADV